MPIRLRPVHWLLVAFVFGLAVPTFADRVADERASAALMRIKLRPDQRDAFTKIVKDYYSRRNMVLKRELSRNSTDDAARHMKTVLPNINKKTREKMVKVLDEDQLDDADSFLDASAQAFLADLEER